MQAAARPSLRSQCNKARTLVALPNADYLGLGVQGVYTTYTSCVGADRVWLRVAATQSTRGPTGTSHTQTYHVVEGWSAEHPHCVLRYHVLPGHNL